MKQTIKPLIKDLKRHLKGQYGERLANLILFGSYARGDFNENSDVDFLLLLNDKSVSGSHEITILSDYLGSLSLKYNQIISILPVSKDRFDTSMLPFYQIVRKEGIIL